MKPTTMAQYLAEVEPAARGVHDLIWQPYVTVDQLTQAVAGLTTVMEDGYRRADDWMREEDPDDYMTGVGLHWETYFGADKERHHAAADLAAAQAGVASREFATSTTAGALLQCAKQGISLVHGGLARCPAGRLMGTETLRDVIWQGRNQALHWEEGKPRQPIVDCFNALTRDFGPQFAAYQSANLAFAVVEALGWKDYATFSADMQALA